MAVFNASLIALEGAYQGAGGTSLSTIAGGGSDISLQDDFEIGTITSPTGNLTPGIDDPEVYSFTSTGAGSLWLSRIQDDAHWNVEVDPLDAGDYTVSPGPTADGTGGKVTVEFHDAGDYDVTLYYNDGFQSAGLEYLFGITAA